MKDKDNKWLTVVDWLHQDPSEPNIGDLWLNRLLETEFD